LVFNFKLIDHEKGKGGGRPYNAKGERGRGAIPILRGLDEKVQDASSVLPRGEKRGGEAAPTGRRKEEKRKEEFLEKGGKERRGN